MKAALRKDLVFAFSPSEKAVIKIWHVNISKAFPDGAKYSLTYYRENERLLAYDNHEGKGHHRHYKNHEELHWQIPENASLKDYEKLTRKFLEEVNEIRKTARATEKGGKSYENQNP